MLGKVNRSVSWWLGDWWVYGEHRYGERKAIVESEDWEGPTFDVCKNTASVCRAFDERSRRHDLLSFKHHAEVAGLPPDEADRALNWCEETFAETGKPRSTVELRRHVNQKKSIAGGWKPDECCTVESLEELIAQGRKFGTIYADPPWLYDNQGTRAATGNHYDGLTVDQLCALPIAKLVGDNAHLHLWTTNAFHFECPKIFNAWGFEYRSMFVWVKPDIGIGNYWRNSHELLMTAVRGDAKHFNDHSLRSWIECERGEHSAKPEPVRHFIERASPGPYLELFGRSSAPGWVVWGNQIEKTVFDRATAEIAPPG
jgi:N6-adenosine-specific RNA methylase IME4